MTQDIRLSKQSKLGRRFQKISLQILKTALWLEVLMVMWTKILWWWRQCKWVNNWRSSSWMWHSVTGLVFPDISKKNTASIFKCQGVQQAECPVGETCGDIWTSKLSVSCVMMIHYKQCKVELQSVIHPILTWISSLLSSRSSPRVCNLVKLIRRFVIFNRFCTSCEYGSSIGRLGGKTRKIICIEKKIPL